MTRRLRSRGLPRLPLLAGWLFADLFLVLFLVGLASIPPTPHTTRPHPTPTPTHAPAPSRELDRVPVSFTVNVPPAEVENQATQQAAETQLLSGLSQQLDEHHLQRQQAGFVLIFASGPESAINQAVTAATSVVSLVRARESAFSEASGLGFWSGTGDYFKFIVFLFTRAA